MTFETDLTGGKASFLVNGEMGGEYLYRMRGQGSYDDYDVMMTSMMKMTGSMTQFVLGGHVDRQPLGWPKISLETDNTMKTIPGDLTEVRTNI